MSDRKLILEKEIELGEFLQEQGNDDGALQLFEKTLSTLTTLPPDSKVKNEEAKIYHKIGLIHANQFNYGAARQYYHQALTITEKALSPEHPDTGTRLNNLASLLRDMGYYEEAKPLYERTLTIAEETLGPDHPDTADTREQYKSLINLIEDLEDRKDH